MAKDDYFVLAYKLLKYLYDCLKNSERADWEKLAPETKDFPIGEEYFSYIVEHLLDDGYIEGLTKCSSVGRKLKFKETGRGVCITPKGIEYIEENGTMKKAAALLGFSGEIARDVVETIF